MVRVGHSSRVFGTADIDVTDRNFSRAFEQLREKHFARLAVRPLTLHCTRHSFITWALYIPLLKEAGVRAVFAGHHYHRNAHGWSDGLEMITTGPVGKPLGDDPSGLRIVRVTNGDLDHAYFALDAVPERVGAQDSNRRAE